MNNFLELIYNPGQNISTQVIIIPSPCPQFQCSRATNIGFGGQGFLISFQITFFKTYLVIFDPDCLYFETNKQKTRG